MGDWRYIFNLFRRHSPGFLELYQGNCRVYLDEYPEQDELRTNYIKDNFKYEYQKDKRTIILVPDTNKRLAYLIGEPYIEKHPVPKLIITEENFKTPTEPYND